MFTLEFGFWILLPIFIFIWDSSPLSPDPLQLIIVSSHLNLIIIFEHSKFFPTILEHSKIFLYNFQTILCDKRWYKAIDDQTHNYTIQKNIFTTYTIWNTYIHEFIKVSSADGLMSVKNVHKDIKDLIICSVSFILSFFLTNFVILSCEMTKGESKPEMIRP